MSAKCPGEGLAEADADILDSMMVIDLDIPLGRNGQVEKPVDGEEGEHVVEKGHTRIDRRHTLSVNRQDQTDVRFPGLPLDNA